MILNSLLPRKEMLTPCFKGLILLTTGNAFLPCVSFDSDGTRVPLPATLTLKDLSIPILNLQHISMSCFLPRSPDLLCDPPVFSHQDNDVSRSLWVKVKASWAKAELGRRTNDAVWDSIRVSGGSQL